MDVSAVSCHAKVCLVNFALRTAEIYQHDLTLRLEQVSVVYVKNFSHCSILHTVAAPSYNCSTQNLNVLLLSYDTKTNKCA
jgi:hypothetical protein